PAQPLPDDAWSGVFAVKPNETEAAILTGQPVTDQSSAERAARWFLDRGVEVAVITLGSRGALAVSGDTVQVLPAFAVRAVDTTAAGDAFTGALGAGLAGGLATPDALRRALAASALAVTVRGASPSLPTAAAVDAFLREHP
ncbi:MAG TPA: PfkB family carbohydrate kinase, partial [Propionibacteriaceae bacterium]|nr:PfkB family carbohydrate kinase [Propionibacteriaceae bacterium]